MKIIFAIACIFINQLLTAQETSSTAVQAQNSFYAEAGGPGILFSANFDRRFKKSPLGLGARFGLGFVTQDFFSENTGYYQPKSVLSVPMQLNYIFGKSSSVHAFEVGAGVTFTGKPVDVTSDFNETKTSSVFGTASFMYRRQPKEGGFSWRIGFTPLIAAGYIQPSGGVSIGYNF
jgi:hypothetical protein